MRFWQQAAAWQSNWQGNWQDITARTRRMASDERNLRRDFWRKLKREAANIPYLENLLVAHYCAFDRHTPLFVKGVLIGALAYFIVPNHLVPKNLPLIGYFDDAAVIGAAIKVVAFHIKPEHREAARRTLERMRA
jgi:uncharacterized membrane protein YkvA (DUF1232 family)